jgi:hypothetical protein
MARDVDKYVFNGTRYASVTEILTFSGYDDYKDVDPEILDRAAKRGIYCHEASERFDARMFSALDEIPKPFRGYMQSYCRFYRDHKYKIFESEVVVRSHVHRFAGQADRVCIVDKELSILDLKTVDSISGHDSWGLQSAAYALAYKEEKKLKQDLARYTLCLHQSGVPILQRWYRDEDYEKFIVAAKQVNDALDAGIITLPPKSIEQPGNECMVSRWIRELPVVQSRSKPNEIAAVIES